MATYAINHAFVSLLPDNPAALAAGKVVPQAHWNAALNFIISAPDFIVGRATSGSGAAELIACDSFGRAIIGAGSVAAQRTALGLGTAATQNTGTSGATIPFLNGANTWSADQTYNDNVKNIFGTSGYSAIYADATDLIINPAVSGTGQVSIGPTSAGGGTQNLVANLIGLAGTAVSSTAVINVSVASSSLRAALQFVLDSTTGGSVIGPVSVTSTDTGTVVGTMNYISFTSSQQTKTDAHTALNQFGYRADLGISNPTIITTAGVKTLVGFHVRLSQNGRANASTSAGDFMRVGFLQSSVLAINGSPTSSRTLGGHFNNDLQFAAGAGIRLDGNTGDPTNAGFGDSTLLYANSRVEMTADATLAMHWSTTTVTSVLDLTMADAKNIILNTTTGTKIGTATTQKLGLWNKTPVVQPAAYTPTNVTTDRSYDANSTTIDEIADVLGTLIADIQSWGGVG